MINAAVVEFNVDDLGPIGAIGGQKSVRKVSRGDEDLILKVIALTPSTPEALRRAEREVDLLSKLRSRHVVKVVSPLRELGDPPFAAAWLEEFLDGDDLAPYIGPPWSWGDTREMGFQVASGLAAGHEVGVVHRDLSANNVRRLGSGDYKVLDFGFARHTLRSGLTVAGQPGTPGFLSPEHLRSYSGGPMPSSDVFGVGALMFATLTGDVPFPWRGDEDDYIRRLSRGVAAGRLATLRPDLNSSQVAIVDRCLHMQPARRFVDGGQLRDAIGELE